jgi:hypothetical protein
MRFQGRFEHRVGSTFVEKPEQTGEQSASNHGQIVEAHDRIPSRVSTLALVACGQGRPS